MIPVIICGGVGAKMWPLSSPRMPKHFLPLVNGKSLFELSWEAMRNRYQPEEIYLQTNKEQSKIAQMLVPEIVTENIFIEPEARNQGPATGLAAALLKKIGKGAEPFFLIQADDLRTPAEEIFKMMDLAEKLGIETGKYITGGFEPDRIIAGCDYLLKGDLVKEQNGVKIYKVAGYIDRSEKDKLKQLMTSGKLLLHANHTAMTADNLLAMYKRYRPDWYEPLFRISKGADISIEYQKMPKGTLEEITKQVHARGDSLVIELPFQWIDFGTWESLDKYYKDNDIAAKNGGLVEIESKNAFGWSDSGKKIAIIGIDDVIVVEGKDGILVCKKDKCGRVGEII